MRIMPIVCIWQKVDVIDPADGTIERRFAWVPLKRYENLAIRQNAEGEDYPLVPLEPRLRASHNAYFAELNEGFDNLPDDPKRLAVIAAEFGIKTMPPAGFINSEHFRAWALCETGHCEVADFEFGNNKQAVNFARRYRQRNLYAQITVSGNHARVKWALSQSGAAMTKEPFEKSKHDVLDLLTALLGIARGQLRKQAGKSA